MVQIHLNWFSQETVKDLPVCWTFQNLKRI